MKRYNLEEIGVPYEMSDRVLEEHPDGEWVKWEDTLDWISVDDRMPDKDALYLIHAPSLDKEKPLIHCAWYDPNGSGWSLLAKCWCEAITHWMPLPEPPVLRGKI